MFGVRMESPEDNSEYFPDKSMTQIQHYSHMMGLCESKGQIGKDWATLGNVVETAFLDPCSVL